mmetsp:Transcript_11830/g.24441  ORF Transcript_11830/g.24441 Transcript_11830/m.24441 type:complete len:161 (+) Transcript_11830:152-634(+)
MKGIDRSGRKPSRRNRASTKRNSEFKWKLDKTVVGAFEIATDPILDMRAPMTLLKIDGCKSVLKEYLEIWDKLNLRQDLIKAFESIPPEASCCGICVEQDLTIEKNVPLMNETWIKHTNENVLKEEGFAISLFVWKWQNIAGKSKTVIPVLRFHRLSEDE